jgi:predicted nucleotidyltransferase component of viral defense system
VVHGLGKFKEYFNEFTEKYVFIGGTACDLLMNSLGLPFRATKDLDIVFTHRKPMGFKICVQEHNHET